MLASSLANLYSDVDLPLPVGPENNIRPLAFFERLFIY